MKVDLHTHTTASDGKLTPEELIQKAQKRKIACLSVTDHDTVSALPRIKRLAEETKIEWIPGIEISCHCRGEEIHLLGYFIRHRDPEFLEFLKRQTDERLLRLERMIRQLNRADVLIKMSDVEPFLKSKTAAGRPHIARALVYLGYARNLNEAFRYYLTPGKPGYVARRTLESAKVIRKILKNGGVPVLAHPGLVKNPDLIIKDLIAADLKGIEINHPSHKNSLRRRLTEWAREQDLILTGGSDFHGDDDLHHGNLGATQAPPEAPEQLWEAAQEIRGKRMV